LSLVSHKNGHFREWSYREQLPTDVHTKSIRNEAQSPTSALSCVVNTASFLRDFVSDIAIFVLKRDVKLQLTNSCAIIYDYKTVRRVHVCYWDSLNTAPITTHTTLHYNITYRRPFCCDINTQLWQKDVWLSTAVKCTCSQVLWI